MITGLIILLAFCACKKDSPEFQCITDKNYVGAVKAYTVDIPGAGDMTDPGLVILARGIGPQITFS